jgi:diguanylate cyclase
VALLPQLPAQRALETGERLRSAVENTSFDVDGKAISSTVSIGIATYPDEVNNVYDLLDLADEALYECKRAGCNNFINYGTIKSVSKVEQGRPGNKFDLKPGKSRKTDMPRN